MNLQIILAEWYYMYLDERVKVYLRLFVWVMHLLYRLMQPI